MASKVVIALTFATDSATLTLLDPVGPNNTWSCDPGDFLSAASGGWTQGLGSSPVILQDGKSHTMVLQFEDLNMFNPAVGQTGSAISSGDGGTVPDTQVVTWLITAVS